MAYTALAIVVVIGVLVVALAAYIRVCHYFQTYRAVRLMRERGRLISKVDFEQRVATSTGTVLFEYPTLGWRVLRVWWTPDDVLVRAHSAEISEQPIDSQDGAPSPFEMWCHESYTDLENGQALLVPLYIFGSAFQSFSQSLLIRFPAMKWVLVRSALIHLTRTSRLS